ncbi:MAG TPA: hypothetical protein VIG38_00675 [Hyphomicrobium sp.]|jgi:EAL domain-containing protein (putative c-di-GMP-specific phosphodiesterase class I)
MTSTPETRLPRLHASRLDFDISMAFQPIVDVGERSIFAYEALVRGPDGPRRRRSCAGQRRQPLRL